MRRHHHPCHRQFLVLGTLIGSFCTFSHAGAADIPENPKVFAPDVFSGPIGVDSMTFSPDGSTVFFDQERDHGSTIMWSKKLDNKWSQPQVASFSGHWVDHDPALSPDGSFLIFASNRPITANGESLHGGHLWRVDRRSTGWGEPVRLPDAVNTNTHTYAPYIAGNGDVYFQQANPPAGDFHLYRAPFHNGAYLPLEQVQLGDPDAHQLDPAVAPDQSFLIFDANYAGKEKPDHLYIVFREGDHWSRPLDMGDMLDAYQPSGSHLSPDHCTLYFTSDHALDTTMGPPAEQTQSGKATNHIWSISLAYWLNGKHPACH